VTDCCAEAIWREGCDSSSKSGAAPLRRVIRNLRIVPDADDPDHIAVEPVEEAVPADEDLAKGELRELRNSPARLRETDEMLE